MSAVVLEAEGLHTYYGKSHILHGVGLEVREGEIVALLGRNGAGKTTTLRSLVGLTHARDGAVRIFGHATTDWPPYRVANLGVGYVPEGRRIFPNLTVEENLKVPIERPGPWTIARIYELFPRLAERKNNRGRQLSGGEQEMLAIARALLLNPKLLLLDEPSQGLAPLIVQDVFKVVTSAREQGISVLLVEQNVRCRRRGRRPRLCARRRPRRLFRSRRRVRQRRRAGALACRRQRRGMDAASVTRLRTSLQRGAFLSSTCWDRDRIWRTSSPRWTVFAAGDETHDGGFHSVARHLRFDDIELLAVVGGVGALGVDHAAIIDGLVVHDRRKLCPTVFRGSGIAQRVGNRRHNGFLLRRGQIAHRDVGGGARIGDIVAAACRRRSLSAGRRAAGKPKAHRQRGYHAESRYLHVISVAKGGLEAA